MPANTTQLTIGADPQMVGSILDTIINKILSGIKLSLDAASIKAAVISVGDAIKASVANSDAIVKSLVVTAVDSAVSLINAQIDAWLKTQPLVVHAKIYTASDATAFISSLSGAIPATCAAKIQQYPQLVEALERLSPAKRLIAASSDTVIDRLIQILLDWGPLFFKIAMMILPFLL